VRRSRCALSAAGPVGTGVVCRAARRVVPLQATQQLNLIHGRLVGHADVPPPKDGAPAAERPLVGKAELMQALVPKPVLSHRRRQQSRNASLSAPRAVSVGWRAACTRPRSRGEPSPGAVARVIVIAGRWVARTCRRWRGRRSSCGCC
jgi:hypothetical protein